MAEKKVRNSRTVFALEDVVLGAFCAGHQWNDDIGAIRTYALYPDDAECCPNSPACSA